MISKDMKFSGYEFWQKCKQENDIQKMCFIYRLSRIIFCYRKSGNYVVQFSDFREYHIKRLFRFYLLEGLETCTDFENNIISQDGFLINRFKWDIK